MTPLFQDRKDAGQQLAKKLFDDARHRDADLVLGLPRGGVPVAAEVADMLHLPIDILIVRKLGAPGHEEFAMGAIASGGITVLDERVLRALDVRQETLDATLNAQRAELRRRDRAYRGERPAPAITDRRLIVVDDGLATGSTMRAAVKALRQQHPRHITVAVPVASQEACQALEADADDVVCLAVPERFQAVGQWYENFRQTSDDEVVAILHRRSDQRPHGRLP